MPTLTIAIAGTTTRTLSCLETLYNDPRFEVVWVLTPSPKPIGRKQLITPNTVDTFAKEHSIQTFLIDSKLTTELQNALQQQVAQKPIDFLLVVDFGYLIPTWLLSLPKVAPVNIHPSALPKWRGSAPGQFSLLYGDRESAVTLMVMNEKFDGGPIIAMLPFTIEPSWTTSEYYAHSFSLITPKLGDLLAGYAQDKVSTQQPELSPTPTAKRITKEEAFVPWEYLQAAMSGKSSTETTGLAPLLTQALEKHQSPSHMLEAAVRALHPWPGIWTLLPTKDGQKRMKIHSVRVVGEKLLLEKVQVEGKNSTQFSEI